jgi:hypothetical protein
MISFGKTVNPRLCKFNVPDSLALLIAISRLLPLATAVFYLGAAL